MNAPVRKFEATPAVREVVPLLTGIIAPSGGGKTFSALRLATGIQQVIGGDIVVLDTENRRALHYADQFKFIHVPFEPPFGSLDYLEAIKYCASKKPSVTIVDSMTHEHLGEGGYLETAEAVVNRIAGDDYKKREAAKFAGWAKAGPLRTKMIEGIKQLNGNFIFCWRAKEKVKPVRVDGKMQPVAMGLMPLGGEEWVYEMVMNCMLPARSGGVPLWRADHVGERLMMKLPKQFEAVFADNRPLDEEAGRAMAEWAKGGAATPSRGDATAASSVSTPDNSQADGAAELLAEIERALTAAAENGTAALGEEWSSLSKKHKEHFSAMKDRVLKPRAAEIDANRAGST